MVPKCIFYYNVKPFPFKYKAHYFLPNQCTPSAGSKPGHFRKGIQCKIMGKSSIRIIKNETTIPDQSRPGLSMTGSDAIVQQQGASGHSCHKWLIDEEKEGWSIMWAGSIRSSALETNVKSQGWDDWDVCRGGIVDAEYRAAKQGEKWKTTEKVRGCLW